jgi:hypothetical protein
MAEGSDTDAEAMAEGSDTDAAALRRLEQRLDRAAAAAEILLGDAVAAAGDGGGGPGASASGSGAGAGASGSGASGGDGADAGGGDGPPRVPPAGWQQPAPDGGAGRGFTGGELELLLGLLASLRDRIPPELQQRLADAVREVLLAVRAVIDWYLERSERHRAEPRQVQDIPIL